MTPLGVDLPSPFMWPLPGTLEEIKRQIALLNKGFIKGKNLRALKQGPNYSSKYVRNVNQPGGVDENQPPSLVDCLRDNRQ